MQSFVAAMQQAPTKLSSPSGETVGQALTDGRHFTYFEIGNEQNFNSESFFGKSQGDNNNYPPIFAAAASGLYTALNGTAAKSAYRVITTGMVEPSISRTGSGPAKTPNNYNVAVNAINDAASGQVQKTPVPGDQKVPYGNLGFGVHPYNYATQNRDPYGYTGYWRNFYYLYCVYGGGIQPHTPPIDRTTCNHYNGSRQLDRMIRLWSTPIHGQPLPVVFTETNWSNEPNTVRDTAQACSNPTGCQATYLVDLFTYLHDKRCQQVNGKCSVNPSNVPIRVAWHRASNVAPLVVAHPESDSGDNLGLWLNDGTEKVITIPSRVMDVRTRRSVVACDNRAIMGRTFNGKTVTPGQRALTFDYYYLRNGGCY